MCGRDRTQCGDHGVDARPVINFSNIMTTRDSKQGLLCLHLRIISKDPFKAFSMLVSVIDHELHVLIKPNSYASGVCTRSVRGAVRGVRPGRT